MIAELDRMTREQLGDEGNVLDFAVDWVESGKTVLQLAYAVSKNIGLEIDGVQEISRSMLERYLFGLSDDANARLKAAQRPGARGLTDQSIEIADSAESKDDAATARVKVSARQWLAERWDRETFGTPKQAPVQINFGSIHLESLRRRSIEESSDGADIALARVSSVPDQPVSQEGESGSSAIADAIVVDAEVVNIEPTTS